MNWLSYYNNATTYQETLDSHYRSHPCNITQDSSSTIIQLSQAQCLNYNFFKGVVTDTYTPELGGLKPFGSQ